jgi:hypothetical protein
VKLGAAVVLLAVVAGCGGGSAPRTSVRVQLTSYTRNVRHTQTFTLICDPTGGTLPLGGRVCRDIEQHSQPMLDPLPQRSVCAGGPFMPVLVVSSKGSTFSGSPGCGWPGGTPASIYWAAATRDTHLLDLMEPRLRCEDDPMLLAEPTPWASITACVHGLWTPRAERLIRTAKRHVPGGSRFPADPGAEPCGTDICGVSLRHVWSRPLVTFVERSGRRRQVWHVRVSGRPRRRPA